MYKKETSFETIVDSFINNGIGIAHSVMDSTLLNQLRVNLSNLIDDQQLKLAGIGNQNNFTKEVTIRNDKIYWMDRKNNDPFENEFFDFIDEFVLFLNRTCFTGITGYEFHYAFYDEGSFYKRHLDQFKDDDNRAFTMVFYLNENWQKGDGGELCIYQGDKTEIVEPIDGKCVFFKSDELEHEVLMAHKPRLSITGWLRIDKPVPFI